jgi:hypothetical protein
VSSGPTMTVNVADDDHDQEVTADEYMARLDADKREQQIIEELSHLRREVPSLEELVEQARASVGVRARAGRLRKTDSYAPARDLTVAERQLEENQRATQESEEELRSLRASRDWANKVQRLSEAGCKVIAARDQSRVEMRRAVAALERAVERVFQQEQAVATTQREWSMNGGPNLHYRNRAEGQPGAWNEHQRQLMAEIEERVGDSDFAGLIEYGRQALTYPDDMGRFAYLIVEALRSRKARG